MRQSIPSADLLFSLNKLKEYMHKMAQQQFADLSLTGPQSMVVHIILREGRQKISYFAEKMGLSKPTVSGIIDRLEKQGLVYRQRDQADRRVVYVDVTETMRHHVDNRLKQMAILFDELFEGVTEEEKQQVITGINTLRRLMENV